jgi:hypothetical protein
MPRILILADCDSELGNQPIMLDEPIRGGAFEDLRATGNVLERVGVAVTHAEEVERRVSALYAA